MAVFVEAISVIDRRPTVAVRFNGGWPAFLEAIPHQMGCHDNDLTRVDTDSS